MVQTVFAEISTADLLAHAKLVSLVPHHHVDQNALSIQNVRNNYHVLIIDVKIHVLIYAELTQYVGYTIIIRFAHVWKIMLEIHSKNVPLNVSTVYATSL